MTYRTNRPSKALVERILSISLISLLSTLVHYYSYSFALTFWFDSVNVDMVVRLTFFVPMYRYKSCGHHSNDRLKIVITVTVNNDTLGNFQSLLQNNFTSKSLLQNIYKNRPLSLHCSHLERLHSLLLSAKDKNNEPGK
jgi:hypothetical protein